MQTLRPMHARLLFYATALATAALYWSGLSGPFLLDDHYNIGKLQHWFGQASFVELVMGNTSGVLGRPVSMASLWFSAATGGMHPFPFKFGNLLVHLACGLIGWQLLRRLLAQDPRLASRASFLAALLIGLWLLHPINVSTVLYAVQRMAQLSTLFVLASLWVYVAGRQQLADGQVRAAVVKLFAWFPLLFLAGIFSKENAAVAPALCLVVEIAYFIRRSSPQRAVPAFYALFLLVPLILACAVLVAMPDKLFGLYAARDFGMLERLLSQPRALMEYLGLILWPRGGQFGIFVDDFPVSTGLWSPPGTLIAILGLLAISAVAIALRKQAPSFFAGWFFYLVAHAVESSVLPLELYFEHRNYLPGFGILLAVTGLASWLIGRVPTTWQGYVRMAGWASLIVAALAFAAITWQQVQVWRSMETIVDHAVENRPQSRRANLEKAMFAILSKDWDTARTIMGAVADSPEARSRIVGNLGLLSIGCMSGAGGDPVYLENAATTRLENVSLLELQSFRLLSSTVLKGQCGPQITAAAVADAITRILEGTETQPVSAKPKWLMHTTAMGLYVRAGRWEDAQRQGELAWQPEAEPAVGAVLTRVYIRNGNKAAANRTLDETRRRVTPHEIAANKDMEQLQQQVDAMPD